MDCRPRKVAPHDRLTDSSGIDFKDNPEGWRLLPWNQSAIFTCRDWLISPQPLGLGDRGFRSHEIRDVRDDMTTPTAESIQTMEACPAQKDSTTVLSFSCRVGVQLRKTDLLVSEQTGSVMRWVYGCTGAGYIYVSPELRTV